MKRQFFSNIRKNPRKMWVGNDVHTLSDREKKQVVEALDNIARKTWTEVARTSNINVRELLRGNKQEMLDILRDTKNEVILGVAFEDGADAIRGPYLAYTLAHEIDASDPEDEDVEEFEDITGRPFSSFTRLVPSGKVFYIFDITRDLFDDRSKEEFKKLRTELFLNYMATEGHGFVAHLRDASAYRLFRSGKLLGPNFKVVVDDHDPSYFGPGEGAHLVYGYFEKP